VAADTHGTRLTPVEFARHVCTSGEKLNAFPADAGRRTPSGTRNHEMLLTEQGAETGRSFRAHIGTGVLKEARLTCWIRTRKRGTAHQASKYFRRPAR